MSIISAFCLHPPLLNDSIEDLWIVIRWLMCILIGAARKPNRAGPPPSEEDAPTQQCDCSYIKTRINVIIRASNPPGFKRPTYKNICPVKLIMASRRAVGIPCHGPPPGNWRNMHRFVLCGQNHLTMQNYFSVFIASMQPMHRNNVYYMSYSIANYYEKAAFYDIYFKLKTLWKTTRQCD